jgi:16S rRNA (cytosine967-C5)-methyltransferase
VIETAEKTYGLETEQALDALTQPVRRYFVRCNTHKTSPDRLRSSLSSKGIPTTNHPIIEEALGLTVEGPFEVSAFPLNVVVDKRTAESVLQGANVYAPGIVDSAAMRVGDEVTVRSEFGELLASGKATMGATDVLTFRKGLAVS